jgi:hypothetical protein
MGIWGWVQAIATGWFVLSILAGLAWVLGGKRIFRPRPVQPRLDIYGTDRSNVYDIDREGGL